MSRGVEPGSDQALNREWTRIHTNDGIEPEHLRGPVNLSPSHLIPHSHSCSFVSIRGSTELLGLKWIGEGRMRSWPQRDAEGAKSGGLFLRLLRFFAAKGSGAWADRSESGPYLGVAG